MLLAIILGSIGVCIIVFVYQMIRAWKHNKYFLQSMDWQQQKQQKQQKIQQGWLPTLWDEGATEEEKSEAILRYARGEDLKQ